MQVPRYQLRNRNSFLLSEQPTEGKYVIADAVQFLAESPKR